MKDIRTQINQMISGISQNANVLLTRPLLVEFFDGDHKAAIMLNQILYWTERTRDPEGTFYKTHADWKRELAFSEYQVRRVIWGDPRVQYPKRNLSDIGLSVRVKMAPNGRNATYYHLDVAQFMGMFVDWLEQRFGKAVDQVLQTIKDKIQPPPQASTAQPMPKPNAPTPPPVTNDPMNIWRDDYDGSLWQPAKPEQLPVEPTERVTESYQSAWQMMDYQLERQFDRATYSNYLKPMTLVDVQTTDDNRYRLIVALPNERQCDMILHRLSRNIRRVWSDASGQPMEQVDLIPMTEATWRERTKQ